MITPIEMESGDVIRVTGPARIEVIEGKVIVVGAEYVKGQQFVIHGLRSYGIKALEKSVMKIYLGSGATVEEPGKGEEVIDEWLSTVSSMWNEFVSGRKPIVALVAGPIESGKTTLAAFISNYFHQHGARVCLIEADVGQEDVAIPGTVASVVVKEVFVWQRTLSFDKLRFVGSITPAQCRTEIVSAIRDLLNEALEEGCDTVVINTDGWVNTATAIEHKLDIIRWIHPSHVLVLDRPLHEVIRNSAPSQTSVVYVPSPSKIRERDREARRSLRKDAYRRYFEKSSLRITRLSEVGMIKSCILGGKRIGKAELTEMIPEIADSISDVLFATVYGNYINLVLKEARLLRPLNVPQGYQLNIVSKEDLCGYLVGILGPDLKDVAVGIIEDVVFENSDVILKIRTPYEKEIVGLIAGKVRLNQDYQEFGRPSRCGI